MTKIFVSGMPEGEEIITLIGEEEASFLSSAIIPVNLSEYNSTKRWEAETGGILLDGISIATDDRSKVMISGARVAAQSNPDFTTEWKTESGFVTLDADTIITISDAVLQHVSDCFAREATIQTMIDNGDVTTVEQIDTLWQE